MQQSYYYQPSQQYYQAPHPAQQPQRRQVQFQTRPNEPSSSSSAAIPPTIQSKSSYAQPHSIPYPAYPYPQQALLPAFQPHHQPIIAPAVADVPQLDGSPSSSWTDTPRTLYKMSPETESGDNDIAVESDDDEALGAEGLIGRPVAARPKWNSGDMFGEDKDHRPRLDASTQAFPSYAPLMSPPNSAYTLGDLEDKGDPSQPNPAQVRLWNSRLHEDIKNATLFPNPTLLAAALAPQPAPAMLSASSTPVMREVQPPRTDVIPQASGHKVIVRQPSMHLNKPVQPIDPFSRPVLRPSSPIRPYPAPTVNPLYLNFYKKELPVATVAPMDCIKPGAEWFCALDPAAMEAEVDNLSPEQLEAISMLEVESLASTVATPAPEFHIPPVPEEEKPFTRVGMKRSRAQTVEQDDGDSDYSASDDEDEAAADDDDDYKAPASARAVEPATKRSRTSFAETSSTLSPTPSSPPPAATSSSAAPRRAVFQPVTKPRTRHLQPNLVRTNGCLHGCPLLFSTPYEARRHQEDAHGREEAYQLIGLTEGSDPLVVFPKDYRFLIQIGLHTADKWDTKLKGAFQVAARKEEEQMTPECATALVTFAKEWTKRYECPKCGTSFSRLDSKKRHYEKQCR